MASSTQLLPALRASTRPTPAFTAADPLARNAVFVEPQLVAEVRFTDTTERGVLRQPVFVRLRDDKRVDECDAPRRGTLSVLRCPLSVQMGTSSRTTLEPTYPK